MFIVSSCGLFILMLTCLLNLVDINNSNNNDNKCKGTLANWCVHLCGLQLSWNFHCRGRQDQCMSFPFKKGTQRQRLDSQNVPQTISETIGVTVRQSEWETDILTVARGTNVPAASSRGRHWAMYASVGQTWFQHSPSSWITFLCAKRMCLMCQLRLATSCTEQHLHYADILYNIHTWHEAVAGAAVFVALYFFISFLTEAVKSNSSRFLVIYWRWKK